MIYDHNSESVLGNLLHKLSIDFLAKIHIFWEGHKILRNLHQLFVLCNASQIIGGDFTKFYGLLRIYELYAQMFIVCS